MATIYVAAKLANFILKFFSNSLGFPCEIKECGVKQL